MGQYFSLVNLDKKETVMANPFAHGAKLGEIALSTDGLLTGLALLIAVSAGPRAQGYPSRGGPIYGRWAGDRIALISDEYTGPIGDIAWTDELSADMYNEQAGWADITEHVMHAMRTEWRLPIPPYGRPRSVLHPDGSITTLPDSERTEY